MKDSAGFWKDMKASNAVWEHPGDPRAPHVRLRNGCCTNGFIDSLQYLSSTTNLAFASKAMADKLIARLGGKELDWGFGSPMSGIPFATLVSIKMGIPRVGFTEKVGNTKDQICRFDIPKGSVFLDIEEMTTSGETPQRVINAVVKKNPGVQSLPFVGALLIRCDRYPKTLYGKELIPLIDLPELGIRYGEWTPGACPLCARDSLLITNTKKVWFDLLRTMTDPTHVIPGAEYATQLV